MALFGYGGALGPLAPGTSAVLNPLALAFAGARQPSMLGLAGTIPLRSQQMYQQALLQQQQQKALQAYRQATLEQQAQSAEALNQYRQAQLAKGSTPLQIYGEMGGQAGTGLPFSEWYSTSYKPGGEITIEGAPELPAPPSGMYRPVPGEPGLELEPGFESAQQRQAEIQQQKADKTREEVRTSLANYRDLVAKHGIEMWPGKTKAQLKAAHTTATMKLKEAFNLGALTGSDLDLMLGTLPDVTSMGAVGLYGGAGGALSAIDETIKSFGATGAPGAPAAGTQTGGNRIISIKRID